MREKRKATKDKRRGAREIWTEALVFLVQEHGQHGVGACSRGLRGFPEHRSRRQGRLKREVYGKGCRSKA